MTALVMLDTNIVNYVIKKNHTVLEKFRRVEPTKLCISSITYGEIVFGLERRPKAHDLQYTMQEFLAVHNVLAWTPGTAEVYGSLRFSLEKRGISIGKLDLLIAAHAIESDAVLITADKAFTMIEGLVVENWLS